MRKVTRPAKSKLRIGSRGSKLALWQADCAAKALARVFPRAAIEVVPFVTKGDKTERAIPEIGDKGLFTRDIEEALLAGRIEVAVHSAKDLTVKLPDRLEVAAVLGGSEARDAFVSHKVAGLAGLASGARVGTSSLRRAAQLLRRFPFVKIVPMRGNVDTRLRKLREGLVDALIVSYAGLERLGLAAEAREILSEEEFLPAPCQGLIACEVEGGSGVAAGVRRVSEAWGEIRFRAERAFVARLAGGCRLPVGVLTRSRGDLLLMRGALFSEEGAKSLSWTLTGKTSRPEALGEELAERLLAAGGGQLLPQLRKPSPSRK